MAELRLISPDLTKYLDLKGPALENMSLCLSAQVLEDLREDRWGGGMLGGARGGGGVRFVLGGGLYSYCSWYGHTFIIAKYRQPRRKEVRGGGGGGGSGKQKRGRKNVLREEERG